MKNIAKYHAKRIPEGEVVRLAGPFGDMRSDLYHEIGMEAWAVGDLPKAREYFEGAADTGFVATWGYHSALMLLKRLPSEKPRPSRIEQDTPP